MNPHELKLAKSAAALPPPPLVIPRDLVPEKAFPESDVTNPSRLPAPRRSLGSKGQKIQLFTNHFVVNISNISDLHFYQYSVALSYEDGHPVDGKGIGRKIMNKAVELYGSQLGKKAIAYDGEKTFFTVGEITSKRLEFDVVLEDVPGGRRGKNNGNSSPADASPNTGEKKRQKQSKSKTFKAEFKYSTKIPIRAITDACMGQETEQSQDALRVLDIILRQRAANQGCLLVRQSFFHDRSDNTVDVGGGVLACRGFDSSFRAVQNGLSLNVDGSTTMIVKPGPVIDFLMVNQDARNPSQLDWGKAKRALKSLMVKNVTTGMEHKISGFSDRICKEQTFIMKQKDAGEITVFDYYLTHRDVQLQYSGDFPCINVGKPKRPTYIPIELCSLLPLQRYKTALTTFQRSSLVEKSRQGPQERMHSLRDALKANNYQSDDMLKECGISIGMQFTPLEGRVLNPPRLKSGNGGELVARSGRWNFNNKMFLQPITIQRWAIVNFSARCDTRSLQRDLIRCAGAKGVVMKEAHSVFDEDNDVRRAPPAHRVDEMIKKMQSKLPGAPEFLLCILPERKTSPLYGPWKRKNLTEFGVATQCIAPGRITDQYLTNVLLKINAKLGGLNSMLFIEHSHMIPVVSKEPTLIVGMDVSHGFSGQSDVPSIAAVVGSRQWPSISIYRASVRAQSSKMEMIDALCKIVKPDDGPERDDGMMREMLLEFYTSSQKRKPNNIIIFRDGVGDSQFNQVLNVELDQIMAACRFLDEKWSPKFVVIVAQKNHHTKFFRTDSSENVPPGTVVDVKICHPKQNDFYMCAHAGLIGTTRPTHYHVLWDEVGFSTDDMQELIHSLSYVYQRSTTAISVVTPICYAHLAASQMGQFVKLEELSESSSSRPSSASFSVPTIPKLNAKVANSMFFC